MTYFKLDEMQPQTLKLDNDVDLVLIFCASIILQLPLVG